VGEGGAGVGDILGPAAWILLFLDIQHHGGLFSPGGCEVVVPAFLCPQPPPQA
jgi:hypothetical protein